MPLSAGDKLGLYETIASLGVGGMSEVDKASDTFLKRDLVRKALPAAFSSGPERVWALAPALLEGPALAKQLPETPGTTAHFIRHFLPE